METLGPRKRGGQPKPDSERKRNNLTFRARDSLRAKLESVAAANQRSVSEELEHRVEDSFMLEGFRIDAELDAEELKAKNLLEELERRRWEKHTTVEGFVFWGEPGTGDAMGGKQLRLGSPEPLKDAVAAALRETLKPDLLQPEKGPADEGQHNPARKD